MGTFRVPVDVGDAGATRFERAEALVDTGATYTWIPRDRLERLAIQPDEEREFLLADGRQVTYPIAWVRIRIDGRTHPTIVIFSDPGSDALLGAFTLEGFGLAADPVNRRLVPVPGLLKAQSGQALV